MVVIFLVALWLLFVSSHALYLFVLRGLLRPELEIRSVEIADYSWDMLLRDGKLVWFKGLARPCKASLESLPKPGEKYLVQSYRFAGREWLNEIASI